MTFYLLLITFDINNYTVPNEQYERCNQRSECEKTDFSLAADSRCWIREILRRHFTCSRESRSSISRWLRFNNSTICISHSKYTSYWSL